MRLETSSVGAPTHVGKAAGSECGCLRAGLLAYPPMGFGGGVIYETCCCQLLPSTSHRVQARRVCIQYIVAMVTNMLILN